jgi:hypothetical protein
MAKSTTARSPRAPSPLVRLYLVCFNLTSAALWTYVLCLTWSHMLRGWKGWEGVPDSLNALNLRAKTGFLSCVFTSLSLCRWSCKAR